MFDVETSKGYDAGNLSFVPKGINTFEFIGRTKENYGVQGFVKKLRTEPNRENTISISQIGTVHAQIRMNKWYSSQNIFTLTPKNENLINLIVITAIDKVLSRYKGYSSYPVLNTLKNHKIKLPTKYGKIDFIFMKTLISELEEERISELSAYLKVSRLDSYELSTEEERVLKNINSIKWEERNITGECGIFNVKNTKNILSSEIVPESGNIPYLSASMDNNGVSSYISYKEELKDKGNCIFIGGKTFVVSYQEKDFFSNDSHNLALYLKDEEKANKINQIFLATCIKKGLGHKYSWGDSISNKKIQDDKIMIPIKNGNIDYEVINILISAVQKLVIKDVVIYADEKIKATKKVVRKY